MTTKETITKLQQVPTGEWYSVTNKSGVNMTTIICELIDNGEQFVLSEDRKQFKRLCEWKLHVPYYFITDHVCHFCPSDGSVYPL